MMNGTIELLTRTPIESWPIMRSPVPLLLIFIAYLSFVLRFGPRWMRNRKPFRLNKLIRAYNIFQIIACTYFVEWTIERGTTYKSTWKCIGNKDDPDLKYDLSLHTWYFMMLRMVEFVETVIFVLRKKQNQVSALHLYHHISTVALLWIFLKNNNSEMGIYISGLNSFIHIMMYSYYYLSSFKSLRDRLKIIKPFITIIQLTQLVLILGHSIVALLPGCNQPKIFYAQVANGVILIGFFLKFYVDSYWRRKQKGN